VKASCPARLERTRSARASRSPGTRGPAPSVPGTRLTGG